MNSFFSKPAALHFPTYILPSLPFRRKDSSGSTTSSTHSDGDDYFPPNPSRGPPSPDAAAYTGPHGAGMVGTTSCIRCRRCAAELCLTSQIVSRGFTGRFGRAYLVAPLDEGGGATVEPGAETLTSRSARSKVQLQPPPLANTAALRPEPRNLVTGAHIVSNVECAACGADLGWKYVDAEEESQRYKVGKYILETARITTTPRWETARGLAAPAAVLGARTLDGLLGPAPFVDGEPVEFDSQDEDECEDLFLGQWTPELALRRRRAKAFMDVQ